MSHHTLGVNPNWFLSVVTTMGRVLYSVELDASDEGDAFRRGMTYLFDLPPEMVPTLEYFNDEVDGEEHRFVVTDVEHPGEHEIIVRVHDETEIEQAKDEVYNQGFLFDDDQSRAVIRDWMTERRHPEGVVDVVLNELAYEGRKSFDTQRPWPRGTMQLNGGGAGEGKTMTPDIHQLIVGGAAPLEIIVDAAEEARYPGAEQLRWLLDDRKLISRQHDIEGWEQWRDGLLQRLNRWALDLHDNGSPEHLRPRIGESPDEHYAEKSRAASRKSSPQTILQLLSGQAPVGIILDAAEEARYPDAEGLRNLITYHATAADRGGVGSFTLESPMYESNSSAVLDELERLRQWAVENGGTQSFEGKGERVALEESGRVPPPPPRRDGRIREASLHDDQAYDDALLIDPSLEARLLGEGEDDLLLKSDFISHDPEDTEDAMAMKGDFLPGDTAVHAGQGMARSVRIHDIEGDEAIVSWMYDEDGKRYRVRLDQLMKGDEGAFEQKADLGSGEYTVYFPYIDDYTRYESVVVIADDEVEALDLATDQMAGRTDLGSPWTGEVVPTGTGEGNMPDWGKITGNPETQDFRNATAEMRWAENRSQESGQFVITLDGGEVWNRAFTPDDVDEVESDAFWTFKEIANKEPDKHIEIYQTDESGNRVEPKCGIAMMGKSSHDINPDDLLHGWNDQNPETLGDIKLREFMHRWRSVRDQDDNQPVIGDETTMRQLLGWIKRVDKDEPDDMVPGDHLVEGASMGADEQKRDYFRPQGGRHTDPHRFGEMRDLIPEEDIAETGMMPDTTNYDDRGWPVGVPDILDAAPQTNDEEMLRKWLGKYTSASREGDPQDNRIAANFGDLWGLSNELEAKGYPMVEDFRRGIERFFDEKSRVKLAQLFTELFDAEAWLESGGMQQKSEAAGSATDHKADHLAALDEHIGRLRGLMARTYDHEKYMQRQENLHAFLEEADRLRGEAGEGKADEYIPEDNIRSMIEAATQRHAKLRGKAWDMATSDREWTENRMKADEAMRMDWLVICDAIEEAGGNPDEVNSVRTIIDRDDFAWQVISGRLSSILSEVRGSWHDETGIGGRWWRENEGVEEEKAHGPGFADLRPGEPPKIPSRRKPDFSKLGEVVPVMYPPGYEHPEEEEEGVAPIDVWRAPFRFDTKRDDRTPSPHDLRFDRNMKEQPEETVQRILQRDEVPPLFEIGTRVHVTGNDIYEGERGTVAEYDAMEGMYRVVLDAGSLFGKDGVWMDESELGLIVDE